jgi:hypothetical protein
MVANSKFLSSDIKAPIPDRQEGPIARSKDGARFDMMVT